MKDGTSEASDDSFDSSVSLFSSLNDFTSVESENYGVQSLPNPAHYISPGKTDINLEKQQKRSKLFRHHNKISEPPRMYSFSTPPSSVTDHMTRRSALPIDYKSSVATLPYISGDTQSVKYQEVVSNIAVANMIENNSPTNMFHVGDSNT